ncbi:RE1 [Symbiodinium sp. CCMP2456]|nr:RE1 [Symbiodinium sp. CCMP2456]
MDKEDFGLDEAIKDKGAVLNKFGLLFKATALDDPDIGRAVGKNKDEEGDWSASKWPKPGVRYRGGTAPSPPVWNYAKEDIRAYDRFERKVRVWERQVKSFMPPREAAMALYVSLRGEAEEELEYMDVSQIDTDNGVENILGALRRPLQTRAIYLKRKFLHDYEYLGRRNTETVRAFCNRYQRTEKSLLAAGIDVSGMYDAEARGSRLLDRLRLTAEQQRLILVATGQSLSFDAVKGAAQMQFPEHRPAPPTVYHREFENGGGRAQDEGKDAGGKPGNKGGGKDHRQQRPPKGSRKNQPRPYKAYVAEEAPEHEDENPGDDLPEIPEGEEEDENEAADEEEMIPDGGDDGDNLETVMQEVAECLTVTARRLQGVTLGRKFSSGGKGKSIEQRKKNSRCSVFGEKGHWQGDAAGTKPESKKGAAKRVLAVYHPSGVEAQAPMQDPSPEETQEFGSYFTTVMTMHAGPLQVFLSRPGDFAGYAVLDTACQRSLCSSKWLEKHRQQLRQLKLDAKTQAEHEGFQFGTGPVQTSCMHAYFPVCLDGSHSTCALFGASVMDGESDIPLLLSLGMIAKRLKAVLDFPRNKAYLGAFDSEVPLVKINGHVCIGLHNFPADHFKKWQALSSILDQGDPDPEFIKLPATTAPHASADGAPFVAPGMAAPGTSDSRSRAAPPEVHVADCSVGASQEVLAVAPGPDPPEVHRRAHREPQQGVRAPGPHAREVRQQVRKFPEVHAVRNPVEMGARSVGRTALLTIATAVASLGSLWSAANLGDQAGAEGDFFDKQFFGIPPGELDFTEAEVLSMNLHKGAPSKFGQAVMSEEELEKLEAQYQRGVAARRALVETEQDDKEGSETYEAEIKYHDALPTYKDVHNHPKIDLCEVFATAARVTNEANHYGIAALEPFGTNFGHDFRRHKQQQALKQAITNLQPLVLFVNWPQAEDHDFDVLCKFGAWACAEQEKAGRVFVGHARPGSKLWRHQAVRDLMRHKNVTAQLHYQPVTPNAADYNNELCDGLVHAILQGIQTEARRRNPARFQVKPRDVLAARPLNDPVGCGQVLDELEARFANTHKKPFTLTANAAWTPQSIRFPQDIPFTHRGAALRLNSGELVLESEDMAQVTYPKQRYVKPVRVALFFFGVPLEETQNTAEPVEEQTTGQTSARPLHGFQTELWYEDAPKEVDQQLRYSLARLHVNMGHAPKAELIRMLAASGNLSRKVLMGLDCLRCGSCIRMQKPKPPPTSSVAPAFTGYFGEVLQADLVYIRLITGTAVPVLGMCCEATNYRCGKALPSRSPSDVLQVILDLWYRPLGLPLHFKCNAGGEFGAEVAAWHGQSGVLQEIVPAEAHHRLGKIERRNSLMRSLAERIIDERGVHNIEELNMVLPAVTFSMNAGTYSYGRSPFQAVFGRVPRPLGDLSSDPRALVLSPQPGEKRLAPELLRADALKALAEFNASSAVKRALLRKTRHLDPSDYQPGQALAYWRWSGRSRQHKKGAWNLGRFLSADPDRKSIWLQVGSTTIKVANNQVRAACGWEEWTPSTEDLKILKNAEHNLRDALWEDHTEEPPDELNEPSTDPGAIAAPPPPLPQELQRNVDYWRYTDDGVVRVHVEPRRELYVPRAPECNFDLEELADTRRTYRNEAMEQLPEDQWRDPLCQRVSYHNLFPLDLLNHYQLQDNRKIQISAAESAALESAAYTSPGFSPGVPETPQALAEQASEPHVQHDEHNEPNPLAAASTNSGNNAPEPAASSAAGSDQIPVDNEAMPMLPQKRTAAVLVSSFPLNFDFFDNGEATLKDGSDQDNVPFRRNYYYKCYLNSTTRKEDMNAAGVEEDQSREDASTDDEAMNHSNQRTHSRKELKQLDREIPWRQLLELPRAQYEEYLEATRLESDTWMSWGGIQPVSKKEAKRIMGDPKLSRRVLKARAAYRDKAKGVGPLRAKCRVVIIGCADPDIFSISRDSPTPTRLSEALLMTIATAGANRELGFSGDRWFLWASDAKSAFLQGTQDTSERAGPLFMLPPKDPLMEETNSFPADLYVITGNCYGLPNAPRVWYLRVHMKMTEGGFTRHGFDRCLYYFLDENKTLVAVVIIHVDDFLATYSEKFPVEVLEKMFVWGSVMKVTPQQPATYRGKEITMIENNGRFKYVVTQKVFTDSMDRGKIPRGRSQQPEKLTAEEWSEFGSVSGSLQWLAGKRQDTSYKDLQRLYAAADYAKETSGHGLVYQDVPLNKFSAFVTYTDSSFANAGVKSQYGVCVFLTAPSVADRVEKATLVDWKSARSARVCRSTLAAEASAADEGCDTATFANLCLSELFTGEPAYKVHPQFLNFQVTDAKSLYDTVVAENPSVSDKRSLVNIRSVQQSVRPRDFRWVPTALMLADALTKLDWKLCCAFSEFLQNPKLQLTDQGSKENKTSVKVQLLSREP